MSSANDEKRQSKFSIRKLILLFLFWVLVGVILNVSISVKEVFEELWLEEGIEYDVGRSHTILEITGYISYRSQDGIVGDWARGQQKNAYEDIRLKVPEKDAIWVKYWEQYRLVPYILNNKDKSVSAEFLQESLKAYEVLVNYPAGGRMYDSLQKYDTLSRMLLFFGARIQSLSLSTNQESEMMVNIVQQALRLMERIDMESFFGDVKARPKYKGAPAEVMTVILKIMLLKDSWCTNENLSQALFLANAIDSTYEEKAVEGVNSSALKVAIEQAEEMKGKCDD